MTSADHIGPDEAHAVSPESAIRRFLKTRPGAGWRKRALLGHALGWPWFDPFSSWMLRQVFLPTSRLWAAAHLADGSVERFYDAVPMPRIIGSTTRLEAALASFDKAYAATSAIDKEWHRVFFGPEESSFAYRSALEAARLDAAHSYHSMRRKFGYLISRYIPSIKLDVHGPENVAEIYSDALVKIDPFVAPPEAMPEIEKSREIRTSIGNEYWIRFKSPSPRLDDVVYARVYEPRGINNPSTIIYGHGVCVEFDHWIGLVDETYNLCQAGFRVIRPEAPWHGRRMPKGYFGGERLLATFPMGSLDAFTGAVQEWAVLADWARRTSQGSLSFGGTSLGALTAQLAADRSHQWPERLRPEGMFLVTHGGSMTDTVMFGEISKIFGGMDTAKSAGWTIETLQPYLRLLDPSHTPPVAPEKIVTLLGSQDNVTPFESGMPLVKSWGVPEENTFIWKRGHFSVPMTLIRDQRPIQQFKRVMGL